MRIGWELRWPVLLLSLLAVLAWLQYRWTGQIQAAERQRMEASLRSSLRRFAAASLFRALCSASGTCLTSISGMDLMIT